MNKSSTIGKNHVLQVSDALKKSLRGESIKSFSPAVVETVHYIIELHANIQFVLNKFEMERPDAQPDLSLTLTNGQTVNMKLFIIRGSAAIQPKNLGAKSFLKKYFSSSGLQTYFNDYFNQAYEVYLKNILSTKEEPSSYDRIPMLKKKVLQTYPKFEENINIFRSEFLFSLREYCFMLLKDEYNLGAKGIQGAFQTLMLMDSTNIITRYTNGNKRSVVEVWKSTIDSAEGVQIYKKGNDTLGIRSGQESLTIRFKFESSPTSSIKLATSYEVFPIEEKIVESNLRSIKNFEMLINQHTYLKAKSKSNAIGKCNEAMIYYRILKVDPSINQVKEEDYSSMLEKYSSEIPQKELVDIQSASIITAEKIHEHLKGKYGVYKIEELQLVGDSYLQDRLDTSDLELILKVNGKYVIESISLKAIARRNSKITVKNPGIGQILGSSYFGIGSLTPTVDELKKQFENNSLNHQEVMEKVSEKIGESLQNASQEAIKLGVAYILGKSTTVITIYTTNESFVLEHAAISDNVEVLPKTPSPIQTTLRWGENKEVLSLRVKFSAGHSHGWSSLKLSCDYKVNMNR